MSYTRIVNFGHSVQKSPYNNPLTYCMTSDLNNSFVHTSGQRNGPYSKSCAMFMSDYCANDWNGVCEAASRNTNNQYPNTVMPHMLSKASGACFGSGIGNQFTQGELLVRNTAAKKYMTKMSSNCGIKYEPFDPMVPTSPMISYWESTSGACVPMYEVDHKTIDDDPVMNKLLAKPELGIDILLNIYNTSVRQNKLHLLEGTKLHSFFNQKLFQQYANAVKEQVNRRS